MRPGHSVDSPSARGGVDDYCGAVNDWRQGGPRRADRVGEPLRARPSRGVDFRRVAAQARSAITNVSADLAKTWANKSGEPDLRSRSSIWVALRLHRGEPEGSTDVM